MSSPLVTVLMPAYNVEKYVAWAIESILNQLYDNFEFLIFEDGSTDDTLKIIQSFEDERIKLYTHPFNQGHIQHLNTGLRIAKGKYIARMDADDIALPERLKKQVSFLESHPDYVIVGSQARYIYGDGQTPSKIKSKLHTKNKFLQACTLFYAPFIHPTVMMRTEIAQSYGYSVEYAAEDIHLWGQILSHHKGYNLPDVLLHYRIHDKNISTVKSTYYLEGMSRLTAKRLTELHIPYTKDDLTTHSMLFGLYKQPLSVTNLKAIEKWLRFFQVTNEERQLYEERIFATVLGQTWYTCCTRGKHNGWRSFWLFIKSPLSRKGSTVGEKAKLLLQSLVQHESFLPLYQKVVEWAKNGRL